MSVLAPGQYFGEAVRTETAEGIILSDCRYRPHARIPRHAHQSAFFYLVLEGNSTEIYGRSTRRRAQPPMLVFHPAGEEHENLWHDLGGRCFHIEIACARRERIRAYAPGLLSEPAEYQAGLPVRLAAKLFREFEQADELTPLTAESIALELLAETSRHAAPWTSDARTAAPWLRETRDLLHARFNENLSLAEVAGAAAVHPSHLARAFRRQYGSTVGEYVR